MRLARFWDKVLKLSKVSDRRCWVWTGYIKPNGYGTIFIDGKSTPVHRYAWEETYGPIPKGLQIDHLCRIRHCVNPAHLRVVTPRTNVLCGDAPTADNARKTHCPKGHDYTPKMNTRWGMQRVCLTCRSEQAKARYRRRLAANPKPKPAKNPAGNPAGWKFRNS